MAVFPSARTCFRVILLGTAVLSYVVSWSAESKALPGGVDAWHAAGMRGKGVKVAVLDTGFRGYRDHLGRELPATVKVKSFRHDGDLEARDSNHGVACAEVIHTLAPDAELLFANWEPDHSESFLAAVAWCRDEGAAVVSCSVIMPAWSDGEGGGAVHARLAEIMGTGTKATDLLGFACAGNLAQRHWAGRFSGDGKGLHQWAGGRTDNALTPWSDERVSVELCCRPGAKYGLEIVDVTEKKVTPAALAYSGPDRTTLTARVQPEAGHAYRVRVRLLGGAAGPFHVSALAGWLEHSTAGGSIPFPGDGAEWVTVGAVDAGGRRAAYSSCGPNSPRPKPDVVAPVPFASAVRGRGFSGTSAATPQAAGLAALLRSRHPDWPAERVREVLLKSCRDLGPPGYDAETGFGMIRLP
jgi:hypothetical protein